ncbi:hypothetical protein [Actinokineospora sp. NBRC 105648]|uniref:hypothetical protein n=1 Tax=Actinokineospora sp. NBRC 105648 TaxID=3032206 RepID=UPI0024A3195F|nr:hypothetical protein [Actinokineospora sp. NBRC 105648]GLZ43322.1 hypothetical protein Acsp05_69460 [Actinokineospora sp. NBRC 105648]
MKLAMPSSARQVPLAEPARAVREFAGIIGEIRDAPAGAAADLEALAAEAVETAVREGAFLMAVVLPEDADPALLTGVALVVPPGWDLDTADSLRDAVEDVGGPDVRETVVVDSPIGPAVVAQRVPGVEQARARLPLTLQLQAFIPEPGTGRMLMLTLAAPSRRGWAVHQGLFTALVASASPSDTSPARPRRRARVVEDESFEEYTYRL